MSAVANPPQTLYKSTEVKSKYRPEIDGLRAFAVVAVIINHFNKDLLPSGYLGVDIFFVISGYVITSSLAGRESKNFLDFVTGFYERRIKRLVPPLVVFVLITSVLICLVNPNPGTDLTTGICSLFGVSNLFLFKNSTDYFAQSTELNPFTHTWSLGVEEQFYLLFPFLIWFSGFGQQTVKGARNLFFWVGALTIASLVSFIYLYQVNQPAAYFLMPPRFWEMAAGCLLFIGFQKRTSIEQALEQIPPMLVLAAMVGVMFLPLSAAVPATISVVVLSAILIACLKQGTGAYELLTLEKVVYVGLISYSLYLWHWTVLSISRWTIGIHWWSAPLQLSIMLLLASLSYRFIETPLRRSSIFNRIGVVALGVVSVFLVMLAALGVNASRKSLFLGGKNLYEDNRLYSSLDLLGNSGRRLIVLGDSHAGAIGALLEELNKKDGFSIKMHSRGAGIPGINGENPTEFKVKALNHYKDNLSAKDSIVLVTNYQGINETDRIELMDEEKVVSLASHRDISVILFRPIPYFDNLRPYRECYAAWFRPFAREEANCKLRRERALFERKFKRVIEAQNALASRYPGTVIIFDAFSQLCPQLEKICSSFDGVGYLYKDDDHISAYAARKMRGAFLKMLRHSTVPLTGNIEPER
jgi:peptidoglycan/LPS O-acetylase OafA/YrhL